MRDYENSECPFRGDVSFSFEHGADSAVGLIHVTNSEVKYVGLLTLMESHRLADWRIERKRIDDRWQEVLGHGHSIEMILKSEAKRSIEKKAIHALALNNREGAGQPILAKLDNPKANYGGETDGYTVIVTCIKKRRVIQKSHRKKAGPILDPPYFENC